jgi:hypothetical protein
MAQVLEFELVFVGGWQSIVGVLWASGDLLYFRGTSPQDALIETVSYGVR